MEGVNRRAIASLRIARFRCCYLFSVQAALALNCGIRLDMPARIVVCTFGLLFLPPMCGMIGLEWPMRVVTSLPYLSRVPSISVPVLDSQLFHFFVYSVDLDRSVDQLRYTAQVIRYTRRVVTRPKSAALPANAMRTISRTCASTRRKNSSGRYWAKVKAPLARGMIVTFSKGVRMLQEPTSHCVSSFVVSDNTLLFLGYDLVALQASNDVVCRLFENGSLRRFHPCGVPRRLQPRYKCWQYLHPQILASAKLICLSILRDRLPALQLVNDLQRFPCALADPVYMPVHECCCEQLTGFFASHIYPGGGLINRLIINGTRELLP
jgi:hypothetical protein